jgi:hypothetical protein
MTKEEFLDFIKELGFEQVWRSNYKYLSLKTDKNFQSSHGSSVTHPAQNQLNIHFDDNFRLAQLSLSQMGSRMISGKSFGNFELRTFGDEDDPQLIMFLSFVKSSFDKPTDKISQYLRNKNLEDLLK